MPAGAPQGAGFLRVVFPKRISSMPGFIRPQLATLKSKAPKGEQWLHEIKYDGYRVQVHLNRGRMQVFTRNGLDWTKRFTEIAGALAIPGEAIIDGEVVVVHEGGTNFSELGVAICSQRVRLSRGRDGDALLADCPITLRADMHRWACHRIVAGYAGSKSGG